MNAKRLTLVLLLGLVPFARAQQPPEGGTSREQAALSEEQTLLLRKLGRLRTSMERLAERFDAEGRAHAAQLLREGLEHLSLRGDEAATLEEVMKSAQTELSGGQSVEAIRSQEAAIASLERLLSILMDRPDLDELERSLEELKKLSAELGGLADQEAALQKSTDELREASRNDAQRALESGIAKALEDQRSLLQQNEEGARESGALQLEALAQALQKLLKDQKTDRAALESWAPDQTPTLAGIVPSLEAAREEEVRAARLDRAAKDLRAAAEKAGTPAAESGEAKPFEELEEAAQRAERDGRASGDESARQAAESLKRALESLRTAGSDAAARRQAADEARSKASQLEQAAAEHRESASTARRGAQMQLDRAAAQEDARGARELAREVQKELEKAEGERSREATDAALRALRSGLDDQRFLGQALQGSQSQNAERAESIEQGLERTPQAGTPAASEAKQALGEASQSMREAAQAAGEKRPEDARAAAERAEKALERASSALGAMQREGASPEGSRSEELARAQEELAKQTEALEQLAQQGSMSPEAQAAVEEALKSAASQMRQAGGELSSGQRSSAASSERKAMDELARAANQAREGVEPKDAEDRAASQALAQQQKEIEKKLYDFVQRYQERKNATPLPSLDSAQQNAERAQKSLSEGDLGEAQQSEERTEQDVREAMQALSEEEEQYQRLREEELLFKIAEEVKAMKDSHLGLMAETVEVDSGRAKGESASRAEKLRLRKIARGEEALAQRAGELKKAIADEQSLVFAELIGQVQSDLGRAANDLGEPGGYQSGDRVQVLQGDVDRALSWLLEALEHEKQRRQQENQNQQNQGQQPQPESKNRLVPDEAELKLLRRMEGDVLDSVDELVKLYPELTEEGAEVDPLLLQDILRMAQRHQRATDLFAQFRSRLGLPDPDGHAETGEGEDGSKPGDEGTNGGGARQE